MVEASQLDCTQTHILIVICYSIIEDLCVLTLCSRQTYRVRAIFAIYYNGFI